MSTYSLVSCYVRHEIAGVVKEVGSKVEGFKVGDHIGVGTFVNSCRECEYCDDGMENYCSKGAVYTFNGVDVDGSITKGGYSNFIVVHQRCVLNYVIVSLPRNLCLSNGESILIQHFKFILILKRYCYKIPENYPLESAAPLLCAGITVYSPMKRHKMDQPGKSLGVIGLGGLGHMAVKFGKAFGLHVTVLSTSESKRDEALALLKADRFVITSDDEQMKVRKPHKLL